MGWDAVWQLAWKQFGAEPVEIRLFIILAIAVLALMVLVGLRYAFRPAGPVATPAPAPDYPARAYAAAPATASVTPPAAEPKLVPQPFRVSKPALRATRKNAKRTINRQRAVRPSIRRESSAEIDAPFSPLPPRR